MTRPATPWPELPLPIRVLDLEIADGISTIDGCTGYGGAHVLLRRRGRPITWVTLSCQDDQITPEQILMTLRKRGSRSVIKHLLLEAMEGKDDPPPQTPISIVVCCRDRVHQLSRCLRSLAALNYSEYEIIVVDNVPISDAIERAAASAGVRYVREVRPGLDWARNRGLAAATHDIIAYTDDDVEADPGWLAGLACGFADPQVSVVTGLVAPVAIETEAELLFEFCYGGMGKGTHPRRWDPGTMGPFKRIGTHHLGVGANMAFRRDLLEELGGFDTALDVGTPSQGAGDLDIFHRALSMGAVIQYEPTALVRHHHRRDMVALERQHYDNARSFGVYLLKILRQGSVPRLKTARYSILRWLLWLIARSFRRLRGQELLPGRLLLAELVGAIHSPWAYIATYRQDRILRRRFLRTFAMDDHCKAEVSHDR